jgi:hypothetical protein
MRSFTRQSFVRILLAWSHLGAVSGVLLVLPAAATAAPSTDDNFGEAAAVSPFVG